MRLLLQIVISIFLLGAIIWHMGGLREVGAHMGRIDPFYVLLVFLGNTFDRALMTFKWVRLLRSRDIHLSFFRGMRIYCAAMVWGLFFPSTVGSDAIRAYSTIRTGLDSNEIVASIIIERMIGFLSALLLAFLSLILLSRIGYMDARFQSIWYLVCLFLIIALIIFGISLSRTTYNIFHDRVLIRYRDNRFLKRVEKIHLAYQSYQSNKGSLATFFGLTFGEQMLQFLLPWLVAQGLGINAGVIFFAGAIPLTYLISHLPISLDGIGVYEGIFIILISFAGVSASEAVAIAFTGRIIQTASWLPWWVADVVKKGNIKPPRPMMIET